MYLNEQWKKLWLYGEAGLIQCNGHGHITKINRVDFETRAEGSGNFPEFQRIVQLAFDKGQQQSGAGGCMQNAVNAAQQQAGHKYHEDQEDF